MGPVQEIRIFLERSRTVFASAAAFSLFVNLLMLLPSLYMLQVYDRVLTSRNVDTLLMLTVLVVGLYGVLAVIEWVRSQLLVNAGIALDQDLSPRLFDAYVRQRAREKGAAADAAFSDAASVRQFLTGTGPFALFDAPWTPVFLLVIWLMHPALALVALVGALLLVALAWVSHRASQQSQEQASALQVANQQAAYGYGRNHEAVLAMGMLKPLRERWLAKQREQLAVQGGAARQVGLVASASRLIRLLQQTAILGVGAYLAVKGQISPGVMIASSILMTRALAPLDQGIGSWRQFVAARAAYFRLDKLLRQNPPERTKTRLPEPVGEVAIEQLTLVPPGAQAPVLADIDFRIKPAMAVGVVGPSGSGKSCLARALTGVWTPVRGGVRLDGAALADWDEEQLGPAMGYLPQSIELLEGTVAENIARFGAVDDEKVVAAARTAGIHELILRLPQGYESPIGQDGLRLSGGQRQRVALARAIYGKPKFIVLDEPNSNLDEEGELALRSALAEMKGWGATVVVITHSRSLLTATDGILVLKEGKLVVYGPTASVLKQSAGPRPVGREAAA
ncbi:type I secretion system permease/ATPase [Ramlibacter sp. USB13]|uniref:Type I secretion system permease/ATPase n=1 Tax=Ramlibacter cellulosilyticus TaxID=2764187 RepID=A0A923SD46_9BURK|nr:type I secretion system permease/ATPase [Ramlibacter cellulosilyticus]MBC5785620.1 type I secretion system permease/ATPase [Ramlibacter cellulosilyticus]